MAVTQLINHLRVKRRPANDDYNKSLKRLLKKKKKCAKAREDEREAPL